MCEIGVARHHIRETLPTNRILMSRSGRELTFDIETKLMQIDSRPNLKRFWMIQCIELECRIIYKKFSKNKGRNLILNMICVIRGTRENFRKMISHVLKSHVLSRLINTQVHNVPKNVHLAWESGHILTKVIVHFSGDLIGSCHDINYQLHSIFSILRTCYPGRDF